MQEKILKKKDFLLNNNIKIASHHTPKSMINSIKITMVWSLFGENKFIATFDLLNKMNKFN